MSSWSSSHLASHVLLREARSLVAEGCRNLAALLSRLAEIQARRLYADERYPTLHAWCVGELHLSRDAAYRRIKAAETAYRFPVLFDAIAEGRVHLTAVLLLRLHLTSANVTELIEAATHKDTEDIETLLAHRFPRPDVPTVLRPIAPPQAAASVQGASETVAAPAADADMTHVALAPLAPASTQKVAPGMATHAGPIAPPAAPPAPRSRITPLSPGRYKLETTLDEGTVECLKRAKGLLAHVMPGADYAEVLKRVLSDWVLARERQKYGLTDKPRARISKANGRYIPRRVRREVVQRDGDQCTFVGKDGQRCEAREQLEYDHITPVARGGKTTTDNLRLRCRTHNQLEADRTYGAGFMRKKREGRVAECPRACKCLGSIYPVIGFRTLSRPSASSSAARIAAGRGGQPGMRTSIGRRGRARTEGRAEAGRPLRLQRRRLHGDARLTSSRRWGRACARGRGRACGGARQDDDGVGSCRASNRTVGRGRRVAVAQSG